jgi:glycosyltransferase involved in cell wall biosynthesis
MVPVSVVIITKNEAALIARCIQLAALITDDVVVIDTGSTDETPDILRRHNCRFFEKDWRGYGANKNAGTALARYNWILSIDADELPDTELITALYNLNLQDANVVYDIKFRSYFGEKPICFGNWGRDHHLRLFNRAVVKWSEPEVHEKLILPDNVKIKKIAGHLHHYSVQNADECNGKAVHYARLSARQYLATGKKATFAKLYFSPLFGFAKNYIFRLGFLDGMEGLDIALAIYKNTKLKYAYLKLYKKSKPVGQTEQPMPKDFAVEY